LDGAQARRIAGGLLSGMVGMAAEDDRFALARPGALEIGNRVLGARGRDRDAEQGRCEYKASHRFLPPGCIDRQLCPRTATAAILRASFRPVTQAVCSSPIGR